MAVDLRIRRRTGKAPRRRDVVRSARGQLLLIVACAVVLAPCYFLVLGAFKTVPEFFSAPFSLPRKWAVGNFADAWEEAGLATAFRNSVLITAASVFLSTACACLASYGITRLTRGAQLLRTLFLVGMVLPTQLIVIAAFAEMRYLGLLGSVVPVILLYAVYGLPLGVLFLVGFFRTIPVQLLEAAAIDGAGTWRQFVSIILPLARIPIFTVAMLNSVWIWNDFFVPLIFANTDELQTVPLAILNFYGENTTNYGLVFAGVVMSALPVLALYVLMMRQFISGVVAGAIKG